MDGGRDGGREGWREGGMEGGREGGRKGDREGERGREGGRQTGRRGERGREEEENGDMTWCIYMYTHVGTCTCNLHNLGQCIYIECSVQVSLRPVSFFSLKY